MSGLCTCEVNPKFQPAMRIITAITNSYPAEITTAVNHLYKTGLIIRLEIPEACGMRILDKYLGPITVTGPDTFTIDVDTNFSAGISIDSFNIPIGLSPHVNVCAQVLPVGELPDKQDSVMQSA